jgi:hypothetical protein
MINRKACSSASLGLTVIYSHGNQRICWVCHKKLIEHCLKVNPKATLKKQRLRRFAPDKREAIKKELAKLLVAGFIKEVYHPEWLANLVLVLKKNNNEWRMCVDYTELNKHCLKDPFALPRITKSLTPRLATSCSLSLIATQVTIRLLSRKKTTSRQHSSPPLKHMPTQLCPSG